MTPEERTARDVIRVSVFMAKVRIYYVDGFLSTDECKAYQAACYRIAFRSIARNVARQITTNVLRDIASGKTQIT